MPTITFTLNEIESQRAHDFIAAHQHKEEFKKEGKIAVSALGHAFTYSITPGGLGPLVSIRCNKCGASEEITDIDSW